MSAVMRVTRPGLLTTVQDLGRPNAIASGVPPGGAMDRFAHRAANLLVGNDPGAATLECTLTGPRLSAMRACVVAIAGADLDPLVNGAPVPMWTSVAMLEGDELSFGERRRPGRAYIAVAGGVAGDRWLGSLSTSVIAARGGLHGRSLVAGDVIAMQSEAVNAAAGRRLRPELLPDYAGRRLHAIPGPHVGRLGREGREALFGSPFRVSRHSDRMGYRLDGASLDARGDELLSFGVVAGVVQVTGAGQPILLMADHQTAGGYPVVATVIAAAMPVAAQLLPGDELRFVEVGIEEALRMRAAQREALESLTS
jgi:antagonist of KipI